MSDTVLEDFQKVEQIGSASDLPIWDYGDIGQDVAGIVEATTRVDVGDEREQLKARARDDYLPYVKYTFPEYKADEFHKDVAGHLQEVVELKHKNLMLFAPPQHGKSELVSTRFPSYWLSHHPEMPVALVSYGASLAYRNSRYARNVFTSPQYDEIFPEFQKDPSNWRTTDWHLKDHKGYVLAVGVGGPITGHGFGLGIIDDPIENWAAAQSEKLRESVWQWWLGTFKTRMWQQGIIILMMTRWHEDDLAARILDREGTVEEGGKWKVISYKALAEEGDPIGRQPGQPLAPSRYDREWLVDQRDTLGPQVWNAEYQQSPTAPEGTIFQVGQIQIVDTMPAEIAEIDIPTPTDKDPYPYPILKTVHKGTRGWDLAATEEEFSKADPDYTVGGLVVLHEGNIYILDVVRRRMNPKDIHSLVQITSNVDGRKVRVRIEKEGGQAGKDQIQSYITELQGFDVDGVPASGSKLVRATPFSAQVNAGNVFFLRAPWNREVLAELGGFPFGAHDDIVDALAYAYNVESGGKGLKRIGFKHL